MINGFIKLGAREVNYCELNDLINFMFSAVKFWVKYFTNITLSASVRLKMWSLIPTVCNNVTCQPYGCYGSWKIEIHVRVNSDVGFFNSGFRLTWPVLRLRNGISLASASSYFLLKKLTYFNSTWLSRTSSQRYTAVLGSSETYPKKQFPFAIWKKSLHKGISFDYVFTFQDTNWLQRII